MTHLVIENQNSNTEIVNVTIIQKIYEMALSADGSVSLKGNLQSEHAKQGAYNYLTGNLTGTSTKRFPQLTINVTGGLYVDFADPVVEQKLATKFGDGTGVTISDVTGNLNESWGFKGDTNITSFNELGLFTGVQLIDSQSFNGCTSLHSINLSNITAIRSKAFLNCTSLTHVDLSNVTQISNNAFQGCTSLGVGETMELTLTTSSVPVQVFSNTKYEGLVLHMPNVTSVDVRYPIWEGMTSLKYLDISDCVFTTCGSQYGNNLLQTYVLPSGLTSLANTIVNSLSVLQYFVILAETPPTVDLQYSFKDSNGPNANIYVKNSTVRDAYLADSNWGSIPNASTRIKTLSELPVGVWKTGLYQQYEPYLSNSSDPAYATT